MSAYEDPILLVEENGALRFVRSSSGHDVHSLDVEREGFRALPGAAAIVVPALWRLTVVPEN